MPPPEPVRESPLLPLVGLAVIALVFTAVTIVVFRVTERAPWSAADWCNGYRNGLVIGVVQAGAMDAPSAVKLAFDPRTPCPEIRATHGLPANESWCEGAAFAVASVLLDFGYQIDDEDAETMRDRCIEDDGASQPLVPGTGVGESPPGGGGPPPLEN